MTMPQRQPVVFDSVVEGLARALGNPLPPNLRAQFEKAGIDPVRPVPAYPLEQFEALITGLARELYPRQTPAEGLHALGRHFLKGFVQTMVGKAVFALAQVIGPKRTLLRMGRNFKSAADAMDITTVSTGAAEVELQVVVQPQFLAGRANRDQPMVEYRAGILEATLEALGITRYVVRIEENDRALQRARFRITWEED
jgi:uncharacterized protein (TIGR02265 family)